MIVRTSKRFDKQLSTLPLSTVKQFRTRLSSWLVDPHQAQLRWHKLKGQNPPVWSISITGDVRALYVLEGADAIRFIAIGTHSELYGK